MTTRKYVLTYIAFGIFFLLSLVLILLSFYFNNSNKLLFYIFLVSSIISLISSILVIVLNYKRLVEYEKNRFKNKIKNLEYLTINCVFTEKECINNLLNRGYVELENNFFRKRVEENCGDVEIVLEFNVKLIKVDESIDFQQCLEGLNKGLTNYNICYLFIKQNPDDYLDIIKKYIIETIVDVEIHRYKYKKFFTPIIIGNDKIYYFKAGSFFNEFKIGLNEGLQVIELNN